MPKVNERRRVEPVSRSDGECKQCGQLAVRRERLAINLLDITDERRLPELVRHAMLLHELLRSEPIQIDRERFDEVAVEFNCDLLRAACLCDWIRIRDREAKVYPTRLYLFRQRAWLKLPGDAVLAIVGGEVAYLNTRWFAPLAEQIARLPYKKVTF